MFPLHKCQKLQITIRNQRYLYILSTSSFLTVSFTSSTSTLTFLLPNWISMVSPVFTCTDALAGLSLTRTLPASHASFATVRRLIRRDTFKYLSNLIFYSCKWILTNYSAGVSKKGNFRSPGYRLYYLPLTISFNAFPALNFGDLEASIFIVSPV